MPIYVEISSGPTTDVTAYGSDEKECSNFMSAFNLTREDVDNGLRKIKKGYRPDSLITVAYKTKITPLSDEITVTEKCQTMAVDNEILQNDTSIPNTFSTSLTHNITHTVKTSWTSTDSVTKGFKIGGELGIPKLQWPSGGNLGLNGAFHMDFTTTTGEETSKQRSETIGSTRGVSMVLAPGQAVEANLVVKRKKIKVRVPFQVEVEGHVSAGFGPPGPKNVGRFLDTIYFNKLFKKMGVPTLYTTEAEFDIVCFTDARVRTVDLYPGYPF